MNRAFESQTPGWGMSALVQRACTARKYIQSVVGGQGVGIPDRVSECLRGLLSFWGLLCSRLQHYEPTDTRGN